MLCSISVGSSLFLLGIWETDTFLKKNGMVLYIRVFVALLVFFLYILQYIRMCLTVCIWSQVLHRGAVSALSKYLYIRYVCPILTLLSTISSLTVDCYLYSYCLHFLLTYCVTFFCNLRVWCWLLSFWLPPLPLY